MRFNEVVFIVWSRYVVPVALLARVTHSNPSETNQALCLKASCSSVRTRSLCTFIGWSGRFLDLDKPFNRGIRILIVGDEGCDSTIKMGKSKSNRGALLLDNLPQLQGLIKRDKDSYKDEFIQQFNHYKSMLELFKLQPQNNLDNFNNLIGFISQVRLYKWLWHSQLTPSLGIPLLSPNHSRIPSRVIESTTPISLPLIARH